MHTAFRRIARILVVLLVLAGALVAAGRLGLLEGEAPPGLGVRDGRLAPPSTTPNSVSSQAGRDPQHPRAIDAQIAPIAFRGEPQAAMARLEAIVRADPLAEVRRRAPGYLYATYRTPWLHFVDDVEFALDPAEPGVIQVRSASRLGHGDWGTNRKRIEALRARFAGGADPG